MFEGPLMELPSQKLKYLQAVWELFHSELNFLHHQLLVLRNVYKEPLKKCQVEGCLLTVEPDLLFGNLDQLCRISRGFCQTFLSLLPAVNREGTDYDCTDLVVKLFEKVSLFSSSGPRCWERALLVLSSQAMSAVLFKYSMKFGK
ncbi:hypothetical protein COOONC_23892 [Cooperia oncophora]